MNTLGIINPVVGGGGGANAGKFTSKFNQQEQSIEELKLTCKFLTEKIEGLEKWKESLHKWMIEYFGDDISSRVFNVNVTEEATQPPFQDVQEDIEIVDVKDILPSTSYSSSRVYPTAATTTARKEIIIKNIRSINPSIFKHKKKDKGSPSALGQSRSKAKPLLGTSKTKQSSTPPIARPVEDEPANVKEIVSPKLEVDEDAPCSVCGCPEQEDDNNILFCDACNLSVHQACYGVPIIPHGSWFCNPCGLGLCPSDLGCRFCSIKGGALKPVASSSPNPLDVRIPKSWAHVICVWWIPGPRMLSTKFQEPVIDLCRLDKKCLQLKCGICRIRSETGACIQCSCRGCSVAFHPSCAQRKGFKMIYSNPMKDGCGEELVMKAFCRNHGSD